MTRSAAEKCTKRERANIIERQRWICGCGCGQPLVPGRIHMEHTIPNAIRKGKPDSAWRDDCHAKKTSRDRKVIAKCKRLAGEAGQYARRQARKAKGLRPLINSNPTIPSRPFERRSK